jgi:hypothetical protein
MDGWRRLWNTVGRVSWLYIQFVLFHRSWDKHLNSTKNYFYFGWESSRRNVWHLSFVYVENTLLVEKQVYGNWLIPGSSYLATWSRGESGAESSFISTIAYRPAAPVSQGQPEKVMSSCANRTSTLSPWNSWTRSERSEHHTDGGTLVWSVNTTSCLDTTPS